MVKLSTENGKNLYQCEECGFHYVEKEQAEKCEAWCREHKSCNLEITAHAEENKFDCGIAESLRDFKEGRFYGPFSSVDKMTRSLEGLGKRRAAKSKRE